jgi:glycosyltransferase involved in cell wall biosynthesis
MFNHFADDPQQYNIEDVNGTKFCWIRTPKYDPRSVKRFWSMLVFALKAYFVPVTLAGKPDVIIVSSMPIFPSLTGWLLKKRYHAKKFIFEIRDIWPLSAQLMLGYSKWHPVIMFMAWFEKIGYWKSDHIVSVLPNAASHINSISGNPSKFNYIPNGISEDLLQNERLPADILVLLPKNKFIIGYTGTIGMANALEYLVDSALLLSDNKKIHIVMVGDGYLKEELQQKSQLLENITFIPKIRKSYMQAVIAHFDVCFIGRNNTPLFDHGVSSNKYFDYMLASKPVLVSSNRIKDPVELSECGIIVKPDSAEAIRDGILELFALTPIQRATMGTKGKEYAKQYHSFDYLSDKYEKLFD